MFYRDGIKMMAVAVAADKRAGLRVDPPRILFEGQFETRETVTNYDVAPDGRFLMMRSPQVDVRQLQVTLNWFDELQRRAPSGKK